MKHNWHICPCMIVRFDLSLNSSLIRNDIIFYDSVGFRPDRWEDDTFTAFR